MGAHAFCCCCCFFFFFCFFFSCRDSSIFLYRRVNLRQSDLSDEEVFIASLFYVRSQSGILPLPVFKAFLHIMIVMSV